MSVFALGLNHLSAPLDLRGSFALPHEQIGPALQTFQRSLDASSGHGAALKKPLEAALLSTCNRTEIYCVGPDELVAPSMEWFAQFGGSNLDALKHHLYIREGNDAARHAFRVASGLDSMVLGETQILGQMKQAVRQADLAGTLGATLHQLFQRSFAVAKEVRTATDVGAHSVNIASTAARLAAQLFEDLREVQMLFVGAGDMIELCATHFAARRPRQITVANRTPARGEKLAHRLNAQFMRLADLPTRLFEFDIVVSCTASSVPIIGLGAIERALKARKHRPIFMVDLAVPRDIEAEAAQLDDVYLYTLDDLGAMAQQSGEKRQAAVGQAEAIIETGVQHFAHWLDQRRSVPMIQALQLQTDVWREAELTRARKQLARGLPVEQVLDALSRGLTQKMLHGALNELHTASPSEREQLLRTVSKFFLRNGG
jgi:glutamyl-tRNA reductase